MRTIHADACDGGIRSSIRLPELRGECAACPSHRATLLGCVLATAESPCDQRTQRRRAAHAVGDAWVAWRRLHLLLRPILAARQARQRRYQELPKRPPVDDLALSCRTWLFLPRPRMWQDTRRRSGAGLHLRSVSVPHRLSQSRYQRHRQLLRLRPPHATALPSPAMNSRALIIGSPRRRWPTASQGR